MVHYNDISQRIEAAIADLRFHNSPPNLFNPIVYTLSLGGKRLRPTLTLMAANLFSDNIDHTLQPALAFELFHNFTLIHDDLIDNAPLRRNQPTVHVQWNPSTAILAGDALLVAAYQLLAQAPPQHLPKLLNLFSQTALDVCRGQQLDIDFESTDIVSVQDYLTMIRLKTATLPAACLQAGAILQNASDDDADLLNLAGIHLGIAFQLQDDLLDLYADPTVFGKATGNDILTAKKTFLLVSALHFAPSPHPDDILRILHDTALPPREKIDAITRIFDLIDIRTHTLQQINFHYDNALRHLQRVSGPPSKKQSLYELIDSLRNRQT